MASKKFNFYTFFKNLHLIFVENGIIVYSNNIFWVHFLLISNVHVENQWKKIFLYPIQPILRKTIKSWKGPSTLFLRTKRLKMEETAQHLKILKTDFRFVMQLKKCVPNIKSMKFCQFHWSLIEADLDNILYRTNVYLLFSVVWPLDSRSRGIWRLLSTGPLY